MRCPGVRRGVELGCLWHRGGARRSPGGPRSAARRGDGVADRARQRRRRGDGRGLFPAHSLRRRHIGQGAGEPDHAIAPDRGERAEGIRQGLLATHSRQEETMSRNRLSVGQGVTRRGFTTGAVGAGLVLGAGRAPAIAQGKRDLRVGVFGGEFGNLSPVIRYDIQGGLVLYNIFDGLVQIDFAKRTIEPLLALEWANPDPLTWRFKLREGVKWQKGYGEFTAEDVVYTWNFHLDSKSFQVGTALFPLDGVKADGKYVVEVKTKQPFGAFPGITMGYGGTMISAKAHKEMGNQAYSATPVGNGPFQIESKRGTEIVLVKNPDYWRSGFPKVDKVVYRAIPDSTTRLQALTKNELDFVTHPDPKELGAMRKNANFVVKSTPGWEWDYQQFNLKRPDAPYQ